jgi:CMP-N-acetylneuraminic acid synthetase/NAD(P)-dependent dehydrogenase (short-subunit alcohol dehydrogenase family)
MICAIVPIKHNSERVPGKNYKDFNGKPLYYYIIESLLKSNKIDKIIIDTNSSIIKNGVNQYFFSDKIIIYDRPDDLSSGDTPVNKLLINVINKLNLNADFYLQTHTTNPLLKTETIDKAIDLFIEKKKEGYDSLFSVKKIQTRLYYNRNNVIEAINHNPNELIPTQNLEPIYEENSCIYIFTKENLLERNHRIGFNPFIFIMSNTESQDIDIQEEFEFAKLMHNKITLYDINKDKVVLVTGCNGGIGIEICKKFKNINWYVIGIDIVENSANMLYIDRFIKKNLSDQNAIHEIISDINNNENRLDCIINNAACQITKYIWDMEESEWDKIFDVNLKTIYKFVKYGIELLKKSKGNIINIGSIHSICTSNKIAAYSCSKAAIVGLTKNLAIELGKFNIRVNTISPGAIETSMLIDGLKRGHVGEGNITELLNNLANKHLLGKIGNPSEVADLVISILNNEFINGSNFIIDGGASIKLSTE